MSFLEKFGLNRDPFFTWPLATDKDLLLFVDREKELKNAVEAILLSKNLLIAGTYGIGKTSFINAVRQNLSSRKGNLIFIDVRLLNPKDLNSNSFVLALALELEKQKSRGKPFTLETMRRHHDYIDALSNTSVGELILLLETSIEELQRKAKKVIFILDDLDKTSFDLKMLAGIRDSLWKMNVVYIVTSNISQYQGIIDSAMEPFFSEIVLNGFNESQTKELIEKRLRMASHKSTEDVMDPEVISAIQNLSQGNPSRILRICSFAFHQALSRGANKVSMHDVSEYYKRINFSTLERELINILSKYSRSLSVGEILQEITGRNIMISRPRVSQILGKLTRAGFLKRKKLGRHHLYTTVIPMEVKSK